MTNADDSCGGVQAVVMYGAGEFGHWLSGLLEKAGMSVHFLIDQQVRSSPKGREIVGPALGIKSSVGDPLVLGMFNPQSSLGEVEHWAFEQGQTQVWSPPQTFRVLANAGVKASRYWLSTSALDVGRDSALYRAARNLFTDPESINIFESHFHYRASGLSCFRTIPRSASAQYVDPDLLASITHRPGLIVDCGAFNGDSLRIWERAGLGDRRFLALEPEAANLRALESWLVTTSLSVDVRSLGVGSTPGRYAIVGEGLGATLTRDPNGDVQVESLDNILGSEAVSLIKMDIEGAEIDALLGGLDVIRRNRPALAISVYHDPDHWHDIPLLINSWDLNYSFSLRNYGHQFYDTVLYALPR